MKRSSGLPAIAAFILATLFGTVLGRINFVNPLSGSEVANFEGTVYAATLICNVSNEQGLQVSTEWTLGNFRGQSTQLQSITVAPELFSASGDPIPSDPRITYRNELVVLRMTAELDRVMVYCGGNGLLQQANFTLRIYRPPNIRDNFLVKIEENSVNIPVELRQEPSAYPEQTTLHLFEWSKDGQSLSSPRVSEMTYSSVTFSSVLREDAGNYVVSATNYVSDSMSDAERIGTDTGNFQLDVIYGPSFEVLGPTQRHVLLYERLSLVCGTGLDSNPQAAIKWMAPDGTTVIDSDQYSIDNGPSVVMLSIARVTMNEIGVWECEVGVQSDKYTVENGRLVLEGRSVIGTPIHHTIQLIPVVPPEPPQLLAVDSSQTTSKSIFIRWNPPTESNSLISYYLINSSDHFDPTAEVVLTNTSTATTFFNVTGLLPGTTYELTVVAVSQGGDVIGKSEPSNSMTATTRTTVPSLSCDPPISSRGDITATWSYIHKGGLPLTNLSVFYMFTEGLTISHVPVNMRNINALNATVHNLTTGFEYSFNVIAENSAGSSSILCGPVFHAIGRPVMPTFGALMSIPNSMDVTMMIRTVSSGVNDTHQQFGFIITPIVNGVRGDDRIFPIPNYQNGHFETVVLDGLEEGGSYIFSAEAMNIFGRSEPVYSSSISLEGGARPLSPSEASNVDAIIGGVIGAVTLAAIVFLVIFIIVATFVIKRRKRIRKRQNVRHDAEQ